MSNDPTQRDGQDRERIDVQEDHELRDWAKKLDTTAEQIKEAVQAVGTRAADVEMHLKGTRSTTNSDTERAGSEGSGRNER